MDRLWQEYAEAFVDYDDLTLARWIAQTLGQLEGKCWRLSHPLIGAYRLACKVAHDRELLIHRLATIPPAYVQAECCGAPLVPLLTRDAKEHGLGCPNCATTALALADLPADLQRTITAWSESYEPVHAVAHWDNKQQKRAPSYNDALEEAAEKAEQLLAECGFDIAPRLLEQFPAVLWEDSDECLEVRPEDIPSP